MLGKPAGENTKGQRNQELILKARWSSQGQNTAREKLWWTSLPHWTSEETLSRSSVPRRKELLPRGPFYLQI